jgi:hypothetical protein
MVHRPKLRPFGSSFRFIWLESKAKELMIHVDNAPAHNSRMTRNFFKRNPLNNGGEVFCLNIDCIELVCQSNQSFRNP